MSSNSKYEFLSKLISNVHQNKCLYDKKDLCYFNKKEKEKVWNEIAANVKRTANECKTKWKLLRERYGRELKKRSSSSSGNASGGSDWPLLKEMSFLKGSVTRRSFMRQDKGDDDDGDHSPTRSPPHKMRKIEVGGLYEKLSNAVERLEEQLQPTCDEDDGDEMFLRALLSLMKSLPIEEKDLLKTQMFMNVMNARSKCRTVES